jgi:hypothetical protein
VGLKATLSVQFVPTSKASPQVVDRITKLALAAMLLMVSVAVPVLVSVTVWGALVVLTISEPKSSRVAESVAWGIPFTSSRSTGEELPLKLASPL